MEPQRAEGVAEAARSGACILTESMCRERERENTFNLGRRQQKIIVPTGKKQWRRGQNQLELHGGLVVEFRKKFSNRTANNSVSEL